MPLPPATRFKAARYLQRLPDSAAICATHLMSVVGEHLACSLWGCPEGEATPTCAFGFVHACTFCCLNLYQVLVNKTKKPCTSGAM